jgi:phosphatidylglycerol:prolipoprotein diacylglycerol transferase
MRYGLGVTATLAAWLHDIDPFVFRLPDLGPLPEGIRWYGLSYLVGFAIGYLLIRRVAAVGVSTLEPGKVGDLIVTLAIGVIVGGRLGYVLFYAPSLLVDVMSAPPFWGVLAFNKGGMASHGGIAGTILAALWFAWRHGHRPLFVLDLLAFGAPLGLFFGRIANFINGELFGRAVDPSFPLAVKFPQEMGIWAPERFVELATRLGGVLPRYTPAELYAAFEARRPILGAMERAVVEAVQAGDAQVIAAVEPMLTPRHPSQLYAGLLEGLAVFLVLLWFYRRPRIAGLTGSLFCIGYGVLRIVNELWRRPDAQFISDAGELPWITRGQLLSVVVVGLGLFGLWLCPYLHRKYKHRVMGGWWGGGGEADAAADAGAG